MSKPILNVLDGHKTSKPPIWIMRQAGRYLPEYRELRKKAKNFLHFCYSPELATEATLQPIRRYQFDAAILFSDILVIPDALKQNVRFEEGEGPRLDPVLSLQDLNKLSTVLDLDHLDPVFQTIRAVKSQLSPSTTLLGFCGAPWTVASYMIAGKGTPELAPSRLKAYADPVFMQSLLQRLEDASVLYLIEQFRAGIDAAQIFESFAGALPANLIDLYSFGPIGRIIQRVRNEIPTARFIVFCRNAGFHHTSVRQKTGANAVALDWSVDENWARNEIQKYGAVQGHLDPLLLVQGGDRLKARTEQILSAFSSGPHIFNLGHGIVPETSPDHVEYLMRLVRG
ncbi:MAG: uroporphyrinogen decarboxylase [Methylocystaceae bacterium]|nr:uroporphyrinogen decarboxylase [Methylocystaceae bacterium]